MGQLDDMEEDEQPTQGTQESTQPTSGILDKEIFTNVLCLLIPLTAEAKTSVQRLYLKSRYDVLACMDTNDRFFPKSDTSGSPVCGQPTTVSEKASMQGVDLEKLAIALRTTDKTPRNPAVGFTFGRNHIACDVCLGGMTKLSNIHFRIKLNEESQCLTLEDVSTNGTYVDNLRVKAAGNASPRTKVLINGTFIKLFPDTKEQMIFSVRLFEENFSEMDTDVASDGSSTEQVARIHHGRFFGPDRKYECLEMVGQGSFAVVWKAIERITGKTVAIKQIKKHANRTAKAAIQKEVDIMEKLSHDNIVNFHEHFEDDQYLSIVLEFVPGGDLREYRMKNGVFQEHMVKEIATQVLTAVDYLHRKSVTHRDLKPENILVASIDPLRVKLTDFGLAKAIANDQSFLKTFCGTMLYLAPEAFPDTHLKPQIGDKRKREQNDDPNARPVKKKHYYTSSIDIWAIGCILYYLLTDKHPFECEDRDMTLSRIANGQYDENLLEERSSSPIDCRDFISRMLQVEPALRISEVDALHHSYLRNDYLRVQSSAPSSIVDDDLSQLSQGLQMGNGSRGSEHATLRPCDFRRGGLHPSTMDPRLNDSFDEDGNATSRAGSVYGGDDNDEFHEAQQELPESLRSQNFEVLLSSQASQVLLGSNGSPMDSQENVNPMDSKQQLVPNGSQQLVTPLASQNSGSPMDSQQEVSEINSQNNGCPMDSQQESLQSSGQAQSDVHSIAVIASSSELGSGSSQFANPGTPVGLGIGSCRDLSLSISDLRDGNSSYSSAFQSRAAFSAYPSSATLHPFQNPKHINSSQISEFNLGITSEKSAREFNRSATRAKPGSLVHPDKRDKSPAHNSMYSSADSEQSNMSPTVDGFRQPSKPWGRLTPVSGATEGSVVRCTGRDIVFGRNRQKCTVLFETSTVSRRHITIKADDPLAPSAKCGDPLEVNDRLICYAFAGKGSSCTLNGEKIEHERPCRIFNGDVLILVDNPERRVYDPDRKVWVVDKKKTLIGYTCELFRGNHQRLPNQPNLIYGEKTSCNTSSSFLNRSSLSGSETCSGSGGEDPIMPQLISPPLLPSPERKLIEPETRNKEAKNPGGEESKIAKPLGLRRTWQKSESIRSSSSSLSKSAYSIKSKGGKDLLKEKKGYVPLRNRRREKEKGKEKDKFCDNREQAFSRLSPQSRMRTENIRSSPSRPKQQVVRLEDRDDLLNEERR